MRVCVCVWLQFHWPPWTLLSKHNHNKQLKHHSHLSVRPLLPRKAETHGESSSCISHRPNFINESRGIFCFFLPRNPHEAQRSTVMDDLLTAKLQQSHVRPSQSRVQSERMRIWNTSGLCVNSCFDLAFLCRKKRWRCGVPPGFKSGLHMIYTYRVLVVVQHLKGPLVSILKRYRSRASHFSILHQFDHSSHNTLTHRLSFRSQWHCSAKG